jgi:hypothetical protein
MDDYCICGHIDHHHSVITLGAFPFWDIGSCEQANCRCEKFRRNEVNNKNESFWEGFDAAINLVLSTIDNTDINTLPIVLRDEILDEVELHKRDG